MSWLLLNTIGSEDATAELVGGNLSLLVAMQRSSTQLETAGKILFIEDVGEATYAIDRLLVNLKRSGLLSNLKALLVGSFTAITDNKTLPFGNTIEQLILNHVKDYTYPLGFNFPVGHFDDNHTLIIGKQVKVKIKKEKSTITQ